jgi:hypothetical protein
MGWSAQYFTTIIIEGNTPQTGIFIYNGAPALGTLIGSWANAAGTDAFGNSYPAGINVSQGTIQGVSMTNITMTVSAIMASIISNSTLNNNQINAGQILETTIIFDNGGGFLFGYTSTTTTVTQNVNGDYNFTSPITGTGTVTCWGAGQGGDGGNSSEGGSGGNAGECAQEPNYPLVNAQVYPYTVGAGGAGNSTNGGHGQDGNDTFFDTGGTGGGVFANSGGVSGPGSGSTNSVHFNGGTGGAASGFTGGASGGNSGNKTAKGNNGLSSTSSTHAGSPVPQTGSGTGGAGGDNASNGSNGGSPGAGGGGAGAGGSNPTQKSISYAPLWNGSYYGPDGGSPNARRSTTTMYQGGETASGGSFNGNQRNVFAFNRAQMASDFAGYTITGAQVQFKNLHSWYNSGMTIELDEFTSLGGSAPSSMPTGNYRSADASLNIAEGATTVFNISTSIAARFISGPSNGLGMGFNIAANHPYNLGYYGYFDPSQTRFKITGTTGGAGVTTAGNGADGQVIITYSSASALEFALAPNAGTDANSNAFNAGYTGPVQAFKPGSAPTVVETWHNMSLLNGWTLNAGGFAQYKLLAETGMVAIRLHNLQSGTITNGTPLWNMPTGYVPTTDAQSFAIAGTTAGASVTFRSGGSMEIEGMGAAGAITAQGFYNLD